MAQTFTDQNLDEIIKSGQPVIVDFWATWCGPCKTMSPLVDRLAEEFEGRIVIGKYNCDEENDFAASNRVMSLPTFIFFKEGEQKIRLAGSQPYDKMVDKANELLNM